MSRQNSHRFSLKTPSICGLSLIRITDTKSRPQRVNSYKLNLFITDSAVIRWILNHNQMNLHRVNSRLADELCKVISKALSLYIKQRFAKGATEEHTAIFFSWITKDSIEIFSITFCTLVTVYCNCIIAKDAFRIVVYVTGLLHAALRCNSFRFKTVICLRLYMRSWYVQCCMLLKDSVLVLWINKFKCSLKSMSLVLATEHLKL